MDSDIVTENSILSTPDLSPPTLSSPSSLSLSLSSPLSLSSILRYGLIFLILAFLGFNIFTYLGKSSDFLVNLFKPLLAFFGYGVAETAKQTIDVTSKGTTGLVNMAAGTATGGINVLENTLSRKTSKKAQHEAIPDNTPLPDDAGSRTQASKAKSKAGYCYIGEDRGFRSCINVGEGDSCMSGDIFPTMDQCINPNLR
jgi:hypothetical protein